MNIEQQAHIDELQEQVRRLQRDLNIAHKALAEAGRRFTIGNLEGVRQLLCDMNARENATVPWEQATGIGRNG